MDVGPQKTAVAVQTKTKVSTRTKVIVGAAVVGIALAAGFALPLLRQPVPAKCLSDAWQCSQWSACSASGIQTRTCRPRSLTCASATSPATRQSCTPVSAKPIMISMVALPSTGLSNGIVVAARFSASAPSGADSSLKELTFTVDKSRELTLESSGDSSLRPVGLGNNLAGTTTLDTCNNLSVQCSIKVNLVQEFTIPAGTSQAFDLRLVLNNSIAGSYLNTSISLPAAAGPWTLSRDAASPLTFAVPFFSMVALPSTMLASGTNVLARFSAIANNSADAAFKELRFPIEKTRELVLTAGSNDSSIRRLGDATNIPGTTTIVTCNDQSIQCLVQVMFAEDQVIAAGQVRNFDLRLNVSGAITNSSLKTTMDQPATLLEGWMLSK